MRHATTGTPLHLAALLVTAAGPGCMLGPTNGYTVHDRNEAIPLNGFHLYPHEPVQVQAFNVGTGRFDTIASATSSTMNWGPSADFADAIYSWDAGARTLLAPYWSPGACQGWRARVTATTTVHAAGDAKYSLLALKPDWGTCYDDERNRNAGSFASHCTDGSEASIYTADFAERGRVSLGDLTGVTNEIDNPCSHVTVYAHIPSVGWRGGQGEISYGPTTTALGDRPTQSLDCTTLTISGMTSLTCRVALGVGRMFFTAYDFINAVHDPRGQVAVRFRAVDNACRGDVYSDWSPPFTMTTYRSLEWCRGGWSSPPPPPPPPPPPTTGTEHTVVCSCYDETGSATATVTSCMLPGAGSSITGASIVCSAQTSNQIQAASGLATTCNLIAFADTGVGPCSPLGAFTINSLVRD